MDSMDVMFSVMVLVVVVSMVVAVVIKTIVIVLGRSQERADRVAAAKAEQAAAARQEQAAARAGADGQPADADGDRPPPHHIAAIAAAISVIGAPQIVRIQRSGRDTGWTSVARQAHQTSHNLRPKR